MKQYMIAMTLMQNNKWAWTCHYVPDTSKEVHQIVKAGVNCLDKREVFNAVAAAIDQFEGAGGLDP